MGTDSIVFSAPGKVILFGEHSVVYGHPAIATAINLRAKCEVTKSSDKFPSLSTPDLFPDNIFTINEKSEVPIELEPFKHLFLILSENQKKTIYPKVKLTSAIPSSSGLGSSAATAVSLTASLMKFYNNDHNLEKIRDIAFESEKLIHGFPSGIDNTISTFGGGIIYERGQMAPLTSKISSSFLVIIDSLVPRSTKELVEKVQKKRENEPKKVQAIFNQIEAITWEAKKQLESGDSVEIGRLMNENHKLLEKLDVGHPILSKLVSIIDQTKTLGRKLTGAGGGGCVIALFDEFSTAKEVTKLIEKKGFRAYISNIFETGVKNE